MTRFSKEYERSCCGLFCFNFFQRPAAMDRAEAYSSKAATARSQHEHAMAQQYNQNAAAEYRNAHDYKMAQASMSEASYDSQKYSNENQPRRNRGC